MNSDTFDVCTWIEMYFLTNFIRAREFRAMSIAFWSSAAFYVFSFFKYITSWETETFIAQVDRYWQVDVTNKIELEWQRLLQEFACRLSFPEKRIVSRKTLTVTEIAGTSDPVERLGHVRPSNRWQLFSYQQFRCHTKMEAVITREKLREDQTWLGSWRTLLTGMNLVNNWSICWVRRLNEYSRQSYFVIRRSWRTRRNWDNTKRKEEGMKYHHKVKWS